MSERLIANIDEETDDTALFRTPELADTIEAMQTGPREERAPESTSGWQPGMEITAHLKLVNLIDDGGMGSVWVADHALLGVKVAVKLVAEALLRKHPTLVERLDREAAALARLDHPNVVKILGHGTTSGGTPYMVMELLEGVTLWRLIKRHGALSLTETAAVVTQIARALSDVHGLGIIHRDIKPHNILLSSAAGELRVKVIDFGISKELEINEVASVTASGMVVGTPNFMSPEQLLSPRKIDARTDMWSLGVLSYYALTRKLPFRGETIAQLAIAITTQKATPPSKRAPHLPGALDVWMEKALAREPKDRFRTARELAVSLSRIALEAGPRADMRATSKTPEASEPPLAKAATSNAPALLPYPQALMSDYAPPPLVEEPEDPGRRQKILIAVAVAVLVLVVVVVLATR